MRVFRDFYEDESGITVIEIVLVLVAKVGIIKVWVWSVFSKCVKCIALKTIDFSNDIHSKYEEMCIR